MTDVLSLSNHLADLVARAAASIVQVQGRRRPASGVVFRNELVLTTTRALGRDEGLRVRNADGQGYEAELAGWDPTTSLALLRVPGFAAPAAVPATTAPRVGHLAIAVARSWTNAATATAGLISVIGGPLATGHGRAIERVIRTSAPMHGGFAGGALLDATGALAGVTTAAEIRGLGVVIPADIAWTAAGALAEHGTRERGYLGVAGRSVRLPLRQRDTEDRQSGLLVVDVSPSSPADTGGILVGDVMISFDDHAVSSPLGLLELLQGDRVGKPAAVRVLRGGTVVDLTVNVGRRAAR